MGTQADFVITKGVISLVFTVSGAEINAFGNDTL